MDVGDLEDAGQGASPTDDASMPTDQGTAAGGAARMGSADGGTGSPPSGPGGLTSRRYAGPRRLVVLGTLFLLVSGFLAARYDPQGIDVAEQCAQAAGWPTPIDVTVHRGWLPVSSSCFQEGSGEFVLLGGVLSWLLTLLLLLGVAAVGYGLYRMWQTMPRGDVAGHRRRPVHPDHHPRAEETSWWKHAAFATAAGFVAILDVSVLAVLAGFNGAVLLVAVLVGSALAVAALAGELDGRLGPEGRTTRYSLLTGLVTAVPVVLAAAIALLPDQPHGTSYSVCVALAIVAFGVVPVLRWWWYDPEAVLADLRGGSGAERGSLEVLRPSDSD